MKSKIRPIHLAFWLLSSVLLFGFLGSREIWTQEWRWGEITRWMLLRDDYFHPTLAGQLYFDKPLLSYWLILFCAKLAGQLSTWTLRLPSAIAGLISLACFYQIGTVWQNRKVARIATIMLITTYYFLFWARTASSDIFNLAGILAAVAWYFSKREQTTLINYIIFFLLLALTALLKGLIAPVIVLMIIFPDVILNLKQHMQWRLFIALLPAIVSYFFPFWLTSFVNHTSIIHTGLYEVYRENILRFFAPFDHTDPIYTYLIYLPLYLLPWTAFFLTALYQLPKRWAYLNLSTKQLVAANAALLLFLTLSGSRRSYYILPLIPFAILLTAEWISLTPTRIKLAKYTAIVSFCALFSWFIIVQPLYYSDGGLPIFSQQLMQLTTHKTADKPLQIAFFQADNRLSFYLPHDEITFLNKHANLNQLLKHYDILITRQNNLTQINDLAHQQILWTKPHRGNRWLNQTVPDAPIAIFLPHKDD